MNLNTFIHANKTSRCVLNHRVTTAGYHFLQSVFLFIFHLHFIFLFNTCIITLKLPMKTVSLCTIETLACTSLENTLCHKRPPSEPNQGQCPLNGHCLPVRFNVFHWRHFPTADNDNHELNSQKTDPDALGNLPHHREYQESGNAVCETFSNNSKSACF